MPIYHIVIATVLLGEKLLATSFPRGGFGHSLERFARCVCSHLAVADPQGMCHVTARAMDSRESPRFIEMLSAESKMLLRRILTQWKGFTREILCTCTLFKW